MEILEGLVYVLREAEWTYWGGQACVHGKAQSA